MGKTSLSSIETEATNGESAFRGKTEEIFESWMALMDNLD